MSSDVMKDSDAIVSVTACGEDCPAFELSDIDNEMACRLTPESEFSYRKIPAEFGEKHATAPDWCPLRAGPVTLRFVARGQR